MLRSLKPAERHSRVNLTMQTVGGHKGMTAEQRQFELLRVERTAAEQTAGREIVAHYSSCSLTVTPNNGPLTRSDLNASSSDFMPSAFDVAWSLPACNR